MLNNAEILDKAVKGYFKHEANQLGFELSKRGALLDASINILFSTGAALLLYAFFKTDPTLSFPGAMVATTLGDIRRAIPKSQRFNLIKKYRDKP